MTFDAVKDAFRRTFALTIAQHDYVLRSDERTPGRHALITQFEELEAELKELLKQGETKNGENYN